MLLILVSLQTSIPVVCCGLYVSSFTMNNWIPQTSVYTITESSIRQLSATWLALILDILPSWKCLFEVTSLRNKKVTFRKYMNGVGKQQETKVQNNHIPSRFERHGCGMLHRFVFKVSRVLSAVWSSCMIENIDIASFRLTPDGCYWLQKTPVYKNLLFRFLNTYFLTKKVFFAGRMVRSIVFVKRANIYV